jgi:D-alanyl-D-alanine carboxypeptidase
MKTNQELANAIESMLSELYMEEKPGAAVIILKNGDTLYRKGYGMADLELGVKIRPEMVFRLGSITKQFTAVCILMLYEQGKLDLQDDITHFLPDYPSGGRKITIEHLLTHTSGIKSFTSIPEWLPLWRKDLSLDELIAMFKDQPFDFEPGERFLYNNSGYILLGAIIEKISGMKYADFVQSTIFDSLGMTHSLYDDTQRIVPGRARGYSAGKDGPINCAYLSMTHPLAAGALASSVDDLALWEAALTSGKLLKSETLEKAFQPYTLNNGESSGYGYGWAIYWHEGLRFIEHGGGINGFTTGGVRVPSEKIYVAVLTNYDAPKTDPSMVAFKLAALVSGHPVVDPTRIEMPEMILETYVGVYQINEKETRTITRQEKQLFIQRSGGMRKELIPYQTDAFFTPGSADRFIFTRDEDMNVNGIQVIGRFGPPEHCAKTDLPLPVERDAIKLSPEELNRLVGTYELAPGYHLEITSEEGQLFIQPQGQEKLKLFAESPEHIFVKDVDATLTYQFDAQNRMIECIFKQGAQTFPLKKVG